MSGGSLGYFYGDLADHVGDFNDSELDELVKDLADLFHEREWFLSGDTCEGNWVEARDAFKKKWFSAYGRQERIEAYLAELRESVLKSFGFSDAYCRNCKHWEPEKKNESEYGWCDRESQVMMHRSEWCEKFEKKGEN